MSHITVENITSTAVNYTVTTDQVILATNEITITLPTAQQNDGRKITINGTHKTIVEPDGIETIEGLAAITIRPDGTTTVMSDGANWFISSHIHGNTDIGYLDYNDTATAITPIEVAAATPTKLTNNGLGAFTRKTAAPDGVTDLWDTVTNALDFTELKLDDQILLRGHIKVTTFSPNTDVNVSLKLAVGSLNIDLPIIQNAYKTAGVYEIVGAFPFYIGAQDILDDPGELIIECDKAVEVEVVGWYLKIN